jgi:hypothetical protein
MKLRACAGQPVLAGAGANRAAQGVATGATDRSRRSTGPIAGTLLGDVLGLSESQPLVARLRLGPQGAQWLNIPPLG